MAKYITTSAPVAGPIRMLVAYALCPREECDIAHTSVQIHVLLRAMRTRHSCRGEPSSQATARASRVRHSRSGSPVGMRLRYSELGCRPTSSRFPTLRAKADRSVGAFAAVHEPGFGPRRKFAAMAHRGGHLRLSGRAITGCALRAPRRLIPAERFFHATLSGPEAV